jgi:voltage-gated potassium channel
VDPRRRLAIALSAVAAVTAAGTVGYWILGSNPLDALFDAVTTITTLGLREGPPLSRNGEWFTIALILFGAGTALYAFSTLIESLIEGQLADSRRKRRMQREIDAMNGHVIVCGWGRVGRVIARHVKNAGQPVVVVDADPERLATVPYPTVLGDATDDAVLATAGLARARVLVAALNTDADNLYVTLSGRTAHDDLFIIARARLESSEAKLARAGADRVVNPQHLGGVRMAAFALQPNVAEFLDVVMHDGSLEFRLEEVLVPTTSPLAGSSLRDAHIRDRTGALVLALRTDGQFRTNPAPETVIEPGDVLIAIGTTSQLLSLVDAAGAAP